MSSKKRFLLTVLSGKWRIDLIEALFAGPMQHNALKSSLGGINQKVLADNLKFLMKHGIISRRTYPTFPIRVEYRLTDRGRCLRPILDDIYRWSIENYTPPIDGTADDFYKLFQKE